MANTVADVITETVEKIAALPNDILEAEDEVLESFVQDALVDSIANNFPSEVLKEEVLTERQVPADANWIPKNKGRYKVLSKKYQLLLTPAVASRIFTLKRGETLRDILQRQGWSGRTPIGVTVRVFEAVPGTRLSLIAKDYLGTAGPESYRNVLPLTRRAATLLLNTPGLAVRRRTRKPTGGRWPYKAGRRFYVAKISQHGVTLPKPMQPTQSTGRVAVRSNGVDVKFLAPKTVVLRVYLNEETARTIKTGARNRYIANLSKSLSNQLLEVGSKSIHNFLTRIKIPSVVSRRITGMLLRWVDKNLSIKAKELLEKFIRATDKPAQGVTVKLTVDLPFRLTDLLKLNPLTIASFLAKAVMSPPQAAIEVSPGYRL